MHHVHPRLHDRECVGDLTGAIGRVVVDDQHVDIRCLTQDSFDDLLEVLALVIGRQNHERVPRRSVRPARRAHTRHGGTHGGVPGEDTLLMGAEFPRYPLICPAPAWMLSSSKHERIYSPSASACRGTSTGVIARSSWSRLIQRALPSSTGL